MLGQGANGMGTIQFGHNATTCTNAIASNQPAALGYYNLLETTTTDQLLFTKLPPEGPYSTAYYYIYGRSPVPNQLIFTIMWVDGHDENLQDENVDGTLSSYVQVYRASSATDNDGNYISVNVSKPPAITTGLAGGVPTPAPEIAIGPAQSSIVSPQVGVSYTLAFGAMNGTSPYTWSSIGTLPAGLTLNPTTGVLSGTPTTALTYLFYIVAEDADGYTGSAQYTLVVEVGVTPTIVVTPVTLNSMQVGTSFNQVFSATGGTAPYTWSLIGGAPDGITLGTNQSGFPVLTGTPTSPQTFNFKVRATDNNSFFGEQVFIITVAPAPAITVTPPSPLTSSNVGATVSQSFTATGGSTPYTWSSSGTLPAGLTLASNSGVMSGTPTTAATYNFTIRATDSRSYYGERAYSQIISPAPTLSVTPSTLSMQVGVYYVQALTATGGTSPYTFTLESGTLPAGISLQGTGLSGTPTSTTAASFSIRATDSNNYTGVTNYVVAPAAAPAFTTTISPVNSTTVAGTYADTYRFSKTGSATFTVNAISGSGQVTMTTASNSETLSSYTYFGSGEVSFGGEFDLSVDDCGLAKMIGDYFYASNSAWVKTETIAGCDTTVYNVSNNAWAQFLKNYGVWTNSDGQSPTGSWVSAGYNVNITQSATYTIRISSDNHMQLLVDGTQRLSIDSFTATADTTITLAPGLHTITCRAKNDGGPAGFAAAIYAPGNSTPIWTTRDYGNITINRTRYGLYRKPDAQGLKSWLDYAKSHNIVDPVTSQTFKNAFAAALDGGSRSAGSDWERSNTATKIFVPGTGSGDFLDRPVSATATCSPSSFHLTAGNSQVVTMTWTVEAGSSVSPWEFTAISSAGGNYLYTIYRT